MLDEIKTNTETYPLRHQRLLTLTSDKNHLDPSHLLQNAVYEIIRLHQVVSFPPQMISTNKINLFF